MRRTANPLMLVVLLGLLAALMTALPAMAQFGRLGDIVRKGQKASDAMKPITTEEEINMGKEMAAKMIGYFKVWDHPRAAAYVRKVGTAVALQSSRQDVKYYFELLDTDDINAFATPGGYIFVTKGLLQLIKSESQLAGVLGHEVGHVEGKHIVNEIQRNKALSAGISESVSYAPGSGYLNQLAGKMAEQLIVKGLEPGLEHDADKRGLALAYAAGYRPDGLKSALESLKELVGSSDEKTSWLTRTHPPLSERLKRVDEQITQQNLQSEGRPVLAERYTATLQ